MTVFRTYFRLLKKHMVSILMYGLMFLGITVIIVFNIFKDQSDKFSIKKVPVLVINQDEDSVFVDGFLDYLEKYVTYKEIDNKEEARKDALFNHEVEYILTIPKGFTDKFLSGGSAEMTKQTVPESINAASVDTAINNYLNLAGTYIKHNPGVEVDKLNTFISGNLDFDTKVSFDVKQKKDTLTAYEFNGFYFNYLGYIMITCFIIGVGTVMLSFSGLDIRRRHNASPMKSRSLNIRLLLANLIFVMGYLAVFLIAGYFLNPIRKLDANVLLMWLNAILFAVTVLCMSYLIGITVKNKNAIQALSTMLSLSLAFISGMFVPQEFLGDPVLKVASFTPSYWFIKANNTITGLRTFNYKNLSEIFGYMAIQIGFAVAFISIVLVVGKRKRQQTN